MCLTYNKFAFLKFTTNNIKILNLIKYIFLILVFVSQNANAQGFFSKLWHNSTSHYNYYYNAEVLLIDAREMSELAHKDNFKDLLSLYAVADQATLKGNAAKMEEVQKKCSHIIDKHSKGKWVDDAYLLMGDGHFYKGDFYAAMEVYEYVAGTYKGSKAAAQAEINILKTYLQLKKYNDAEALYTKLNANKNFPLKLRNELNIAGAEVNIQQKKYATAIKLLEITIPKTKGKSKKIRYNFVLAQLYALVKKNTESNERYKKVVKLNPPYEFAFNAKLNMAKAINPKNRNEVNQAIASLQDMLRDDKNIDFFDQIYFELGNLALLDKNEPQAIAYYSNVLRSKSNDMPLKSSTYMALADLYFKNQDYPNAQVYFDSAARTVDKANPNYDAIINKNKVLNELIKHLVTIKTNDSLLKLSENDKLREKTIDKLIKEEKQRAEEEKRKEELQKITQQNILQNGGSPIVNTTFPFYNQTARAKGLQDFQRIWGNRELLDFWAISSNKSAIWKKIDDEQKTNDFGSEAKNKLLADAPPERKKYYENIPFTKEEKQKLKDALAESYFLGANVYYQNLKEYDKAKKMLEELVTKYPKNKYELNAYYLLAKIYTEKNNAEKAKYYTDLIRKTDSMSNFLAILENKEIKDSTKNNTTKADDEVHKLYVETYSAYQSNNFTQVLALKKDNDSKFPGSPLQVNFDYLEALSLAKIGNAKEFETKLTAIVDNYPETPIGKQAVQTLQLLKKKNMPEGTKEDNTNKDKYKFDKNANHFFVLVLPKGVGVDKMKASFSSYHRTNYPADELQITSSFLGSNAILIVNNFKTISDIKDYTSLAKNNNNILEDLKTKEPQMFIISTENYGILSKDKILEDYLTFYKNNF